jgi:hypothetical protein
MVNAAFQELQNPQYAAALQLMNNARDAYDDRPRRGRDACANVFDTMESVAKIKSNRPNDTFGAVKNYIEQNYLLRQEVSNILTALNAMRNGHFGHGMKEVFDLTAAEVAYVFQQKDADHYHTVGKIPTRGGAGTSFWSPDLNRYYVAAPANDKQEAAILVYAPQD